MKLTASDKKWLKIGGGVVGAIVLYKLFAPKTDTAGAVVDPTGNGGSGSTPGYVFNPISVANKLLVAMDRFGTDEDAIISALTPINASQFTQVRTAFGMRKYNDTLGTSHEWVWDTLTKRPLEYWLKKELSTARYNFLAMKFPQLK